MVVDSSSCARAQNSSTAWRFGKRRHRVLDLASDPQKLRGSVTTSAGWGSAASSASSSGAAVDDLLEVVQQEQQLPIADMGGECVLCTKRLGDRLSDERRITQ